MAYGTFEEVPAGDVFRRVVETNLFGQVHGTRAALPYFRQGAGALVRGARGRVDADIITPYPPVSPSSLTARSSPRRSSTTYKKSSPSADSSRAPPTGRSAAFASSHRPAIDARR